MDFVKIVHPIFSSIKNDDKTRFGERVLSIRARDISEKKICSVSRLKLRRKQTKTLKFFDAIFIT